MAIRSSGNISRPGRQETAAPGGPPTIIDLIMRDLGVGEAGHIGTFPSTFPTDVLSPGTFPVRGGGQSFPGENVGISLADILGPAVDVADIGPGTINRDIIDRSIPGQPTPILPPGPDQPPIDLTDISNVIGETPDVVDIGPGDVNRDLIDLPIFTQPDGSARPGAGNQRIEAGGQQDEELAPIDLGEIPGRIGGEDGIDFERLGRLFELGGDIGDFSQSIGGGGGSRMANGTRTTTTRAGQILDPFGLNLDTRTARLLGRVGTDNQIEIGLSGEGLERPSALRDRFITGAEDLLSRTRERSALGERLLGDFVGESRGLLDRFRDNREGFIASQVNPLIRQLQRVPRKTARDFARRNIAGSIPASVVSQQEQEVGRTIAEARAQAEAQAVGIERELLNNFMAARESRLAERAQNLGLQGQALDNFLQASQSALQEELGKLGLSTEAARIIAGSRQVVGEDRETEFDEDFDFGGALGGLGALLTGIGNL